MTPEGMRTEIAFYEANGVSVKQLVCPDIGDTVFQHIHKYDHLTLLASGAVEVWIDDKNDGERHAPAVLIIPAGTKHKFVAIRSNTVLYCIHNADRLIEYTEHFAEA